MKPIENIFKNSLKVTKMFNEQVAKSFKIPVPLKIPVLDWEFIINLGTCKSKSLPIKFKFYFRQFN